MPEQQDVENADVTEVRDGTSAAGEQPRDAAQALVDEVRDAPSPADTQTADPQIDPAYVAKLERENRKRVGDVAALKRQLGELSAGASQQRDALATALGVPSDQTDPDALTQTVEQLVAERDALRAEVRQERVSHIVAEVARAAGAWDMELVLGAVDLDAVAVDSRGRVDADSAAGLVEALRQRKPRLFEAGRAKPPLGGTKPGQATDARTVFTRSQLRDPEFYARHRDAILSAQAVGRITDG